VTRPVDVLLAPRSVAIVGASPREDAIGFRVIRNLRRLGYPGRIVPVNPRYPEVAGLSCYPSLTALPEAVDAAFIAVPNTSGPALVEEAGKAGIQALIVNASGYADGGPEGRALEQPLVAAATAHGIPVAGPNNMGYVNVHGRVAMWTAARLPEFRPGPVAIISQSGSIALALSQDERALGIAYVISAGNEAVVTAADYLDAVVRDDAVRVVLVFLETIRDPTRAGAVLDGVRGAGPFDAGAAARAIAALSAFGAAIHGQLAAVDVNPLIVFPQGSGAVGVDVLLESPGA
jgi:acyl-CoA synthetase (NDP forming)